ncbi:unnamed protein product [Calicophoron daubneyi]|uniref:Uncharacterized protein n=1 Tax=Calicophoron daubneyi TaxID=300641 RepID=A0AAV2TBD2_CALDB
MAQLLKGMFAVCPRNTTSQARRQVEEEDKGNSYIRCVRSAHPTPCLWSTRSGDVGVYPYFASAGITEDGPSTRMVYEVAASKTLPVKPTKRALGAQISVAPSARGSTTRIDCITPTPSDPAIERSDDRTTGQRERIQERFFDSFTHRRPYKPRRQHPRCLVSLGSLKLNFSPSAAHHRSILS